jgi:serine protease Do
MNSMRWMLTVLLGLTCCATHAAPPNTREQKVRADKAKVEAEGFWIYNDLAKGFEQARATGKPLVVVLRCIPCEECVKLDDELVDTDPVIRPLLEKYVCVRIVGTNGLDLSLFQYDTDQSFAVFLLNADKTIYGRFGTRSHRTEWIGDVSLTGLAKALEKGLELHAAYPSNREALAGKRGPAMEVASPEQYPSLKEKYTAALNYEGNVVQSCIHCHQIGDAQREFYWKKNQPIPESVMFPAPHPSVVGLTLDPKECATVLKVEPGSAVEAAGLKSGDAIQSLAGQPLLSIADVQWVLHRTPAEGGEVAAKVLRDGKTVTATIKLPAGWKRAGDISWRVTSWGLRRMTLGGMRLEPLTPTDRETAGLKPQQKALRVAGVGKYGAHATAMKAGIQEGDILVAFDGQSNFDREADIFWHVVTKKHPGDKVTIGVLRGGKPMEFTLPMQE